MWQAEAESPYQSIFREKGEDVQKLSVIETLPQLLAEDAHSCITRVLPKIQQSLPTASTEFHMAASVVFKQVLEQRLVSNSTFTEVFLRSILTSLDSREPAITNAWLETILDIIELLPVDIIKREILPIAKNAGQLSQPVNSRIMCSRLIGKMSTRFDGISVQKDIFPTVQSLCQDVNNEVRACVCLQLHNIVRNVGADIIKLIPFLVELTNDESINVRQAAVEATSHFLPKLQSETIKEVMIPLIKSTFESAVKTDDDVLGVIAKEYGKIVENIDKYVTDEDKKWFISYFENLAQMGTKNLESSKHDYTFNILNNVKVSDKSIEYRESCASNIPSMFIFAASTTDGVTSLISTFRNLINDSNYGVRKTVACILQDIIKILGSRSRSVKIELIKLLKDNNEEVLQNLIPHISDILLRLSEHQLIGIEHTDSSSLELGRAIIKSESKISTTHNWRLSVLILTQFETLPKYFSSDFIYTYMVPIVSNRIMHARPLPVRLAAGRSLLVFLRYNLSFQQRIEIRNQICTEFAHSSNCYMRMIFIRIMIQGMSIFSSVYFKEHFCPTLLNLMDDPIANIRYKIVTLVPTIKACLRLPADKLLLYTLETNIRNLMNNEKDRDVSAALVEVASQLESIQVIIDSQPSPTKMSRYNSEDMKKYEEEKKLEAISNKTIANVKGLLKKRTYSKPTASRISMVGTSSNNKGNLQRSSEFSKSTVASKPSLTRQNAISSRQVPDQSKSSTSTDNLTSNWSRCTSNNSRLIKPWERTTSFCHNTNLTSTNPSYDCLNEYAIQKGQCSCYELTNRILRTQPFSSGLPKQTSYSDSAECSYINGPDQNRATNLFHSDHDYKFSNLTKPSLITNARDDKHDIWQDLMLTRSSLISKYSIPDFDRFQSHYNPYWTFSSMPKIPVTLVDDEFMVDAGIRIPSQLTSSQSSSRIPNAQDILYGNKKVSNNDRIRRCGSTFDKTKPMSFGLPRRFSMEYEDSGKSLLMPPPSSSSLSTSNPESQYSQSRMDDRSNQSGVAHQQKTRFGFELNERKLLDDQTKRNFTLRDKNGPKQLQPKNIVDKNKRHSTSFSMKLTDTKESKPKFKRHSMEVSDYDPGDCSTAGRTLRRFSTLDVNHNQGLSKIPIRNIHTSGSRTAPGTRTSSPIRLDSELFEKAGYGNAPSFSHDGRLRRFRSSDEEVEKFIKNFDKLHRTDEKTALSKHASKTFAQ